MKVASTFLVTFITLVFLIQCQGDPESAQFVPSKRSVIAELTSSNDTSNLIANIITGDGNTAPINFSLSKNNEISFEISQNMWRVGSDPDPVLKLLSMGNTTFDDPPPQQYASLRLEFRQEIFNFSGNSSTSINAKNLFAQTEISFTLQDIFNSHTYVVDNPLTLVDSNIQRIKIVDQNTLLPVPKAKIIGIASGNVGSDATPAWKSPQYRPLVISADSNGEAIIYPLISGTSSTSFGIVAWDKNHCTTVSSATSTDANTPIVFGLQPCSRLDDENIGIVASFDPNIVVGEEELDGVSYKLGYTNQTTIRLRIDSLSNTMRALTVVVYEGLSTKDGIQFETIDTSQLVGTKQMFPFSSVLEVNLPETFRTSGTSTGLFLITVSSQITGDSEYHGDANYLTTQMFGRREVNTISTDFINNLTIQGPIVDDVISGLNHSSYTLHDIFCEDLSSLGLSSELTTTPVFHRCTNGSAEFKFEDLEFTTTTGYNTINAILRDKYGNSSADNINGSSTKTRIYVDYDAPDLNQDEFKLGTNLGFVLISDPSKSYPVGGNDAIILTPSLSPGTIGFKFADVETCRSATTTNAIERSIQDGINNRIQQFQVVASSDDINISNYVDCKGSSEPTVYSIESGNISFPSSSSEDGSFVISIRDPAGNIGSSVTYSIPHCPSILLGTDVQYCWRE